MVSELLRKKNPINDDGAGIDTDTDTDADNDLVQANNVVAKGTNYHTIDDGSSSDSDVRSHVRNQDDQDDHDEDRHGNQSKHGVNDDVNDDEDEDHSTYTVSFSSDITGLEIVAVEGHLFPEVVGVAEQSEAEGCGVKVSNNQQSKSIIYNLIRLQCLCLYYY